MSGVITRSAHVSAGAGDANYDLPWWKSTVIYQIYPRSFKDSNGDGIGDLQGIISKLDHFVYLGVETLWLSPFYKSPQVDFGYDVSDHKDVDPIFGTLADFRELVEACHSRGLRIMVDFVPNHTSTQHEWFQRSLKKDGKYTDFYVWTDGKLLPDGTRTIPNNWLSLFGGTTWEWSEERQQYYYHAFDPSQADLNYRNTDVQEEMMLIVRYWLDQGVDGMRVDAIANLYESEDLSQDHLHSGKDVPPNEWDYYNAIHTDFLPECKDEIMRWQKVFDEKKQMDGRERFMVLEFYTDSKTRASMAEYDAHPFNLDMIEGISIPPRASQMMELIAQEYTDKPENYWPTFVVGNHDRKRVATKYGSRYVDAFNLLLMTLKGTPTTYYGEELGMEDIHVSFEDTQDPYGLRAGPERYTVYSRDGCRTPMQWEPGRNAGFSTSEKTWLPVNPDHAIRNVQAQKEDPNSHLNLYKEYVALRKLDVFKYGDIDVNCVLNENVLSYVRSHGSHRYLVAINFGQESSTDDYRGQPINTDQGSVISCTGSVSADLSKGKVIDLTKLTLEPGNGLVIKLLTNE